MLGPPSSALERAADATGLRFAREAFVDRGYVADGSLVPRGEPGAIVDDPAACRGPRPRAGRDGGIEADDGSRVELAPDSLCLHGDTPGAVAMARAVRDALDEAAGRGPGLREPPPAAERRRRTARRVRLARGGAGAARRARRRSAERRGRPRARRAHDPGADRPRAHPAESAATWVRRVPAEAGSRVAGAAADRVVIPVAYDGDDLRRRPTCSRSRPTSSSRGTRRSSGASRSSASRPASATS